MRLSVMTFNVWGSHLWPERKEALVKTLMTTLPDVLLLQEVSSDILSTLDECLDDYARVEDQPSVTGWQTESQIYWNKSMLEVVTYGYSSYNNQELPLRGLFWARLRCCSDRRLSIFVSTVHLPWTGNATEVLTGVNQRIVCMHPVITALNTLILPSDTAAFIGGDFNEDFHPNRMLRSIGFKDVFELFDVPPPITHPVRPSSPFEELRPNRTLDWIFCRMPDPCRVVSALAKGVRGGGFPPPSDHLPVLCIVDLTPL